MYCGTKNRSVLNYINGKIEYFETLYFKSLKRRHEESEDLD
ncbi:MAG TPA: hypothetical protein PLF27_07540 [Sedimentibacter sp.]|nr:hypothetical protein [Sedimentibacter sp.]